jgi:hypothetical protein
MIQREGGLLKLPSFAFTLRHWRSVVSVANATQKDAERHDEQGH